MRSLAFWLGTGLLVLGTLSATVAMVTVKWIYPAGPSASASPVRTASGSRPGSPYSAAPVPTDAGSAASRSTAAPSPPPSSYAAQIPAEQGPAAPAANRQQAALELIRLAAGGDLKGAMSLVAPDAGITEEMLQDQVSRLFPVPTFAAPLPGPDEGPAELLVWAQYRREGQPARGAYHVSVAGNGAVQGIAGPLAPEGGYAKLPWAPLNEQAHKVDPSTYAGRGLILVAPRTPEPGLAEAMAQLYRDWKDRGVDVVLVIDIRSPDWIPVARAAGFQGPVWLVKGRLEDVPVVSPGVFLGAVGLLVDREGSVVASLTALDPLRYNLADASPVQTAPLVLKAYGLLP